MKSAGKGLKLFGIVALFFLGFNGVFAYNTTTKILGVMSTDTGEEGITADLFVNVVNGTGKVFISTIPLTEIDTQASARLAKEVACETLNMECDGYDFFYEIYSEFPIVGGPSAGGAMAVATMAALEGIDIYENVYMTGTINPDGSIGSVGGILAKAEAAYKSGANFVLIPRGQTITYVEETRTVTVGAITKTETVIRPVNVVQYAKENWGLDVIEVSEVDSAFEQMTGYEIVKQTRPITIATNDYYILTKKMSTGLLSYASEWLSNATEYLGTKALAYSDAQKVQNLLDQSQEYLSQAQQMNSIHQYYSSASYCVQSSILSKYAHKLVAYYSGDYSSREAIKLDIDRTMERASLLQNSTLFYSEIDHIYDIELLIVSIDRLREAETIIENAYQSYYSRNYEDSLYYDAYSEVRLLTAESWRGLLDEFSGEMNLSFYVGKLSSLARERLESARVSLTYASTVASGSLLDSSQNHLSSADSAYNEEKFVYSIFGSLKSMAEANLAMELRGLSETEVQEKISSKRTDAQSSIDQAKQEGMLPILAVSYYEYSKSYEDPYQSLIFLSYSKEFAKISRDFVRAISEEQGYQQITGPVYIRRSVERAEPSAFAYLFIAAGFFAGITISLFSLEKISRKAR